MEQFFKNRNLPAITIEDERQAVSVANAVIDGGLDIMEIPFRTPSAANCIKLIKESVPGLQVGAGTILTPEQVVLAKESGASFGLAPGFNPKVVKEAAMNDFPLIPGVMTPSEVEFALELGCEIQKLFPAAQVGGISMLKALLGPYGHTGVKFIPMGGVSLHNMVDYLEMENVLAIGGSWLATKELIANKDYETITKNVRTAIDNYKLLNE